MLQDIWKPCVLFALAVAAFWAWGGWFTLWPGNIGWIMHGEDIPAQYLGWEFFRYTPWQWPPGMNPAYGLDAPGSVVLADSIPLVALPLKLFSAWLPAQFQYFGAWVFSCFLLQAWFAYLLIRRISNDPVLQLVGAAFFAVASVFLVQSYLHPSLGAQWVLLAGFYLALEPKFRSRTWVVLLCLAVLVHAYLFVMLGALWCGDVLQRLWRREIHGLRAGSHAIVALGCVLGVMWLAGYFTSLAPGMLTASIQTYTDLFFPFWPGNASSEWSWLLPASRIGALASGGFGYFGLGFLFLCLVAMVSPLRKHSNGVARPEKRVRKSTWVMLFVVCGLLFLFSLGPAIRFAGEVLFSYPEPAWLERINTIFRGKGRMMWPLWYLVLFGCFAILSRYRSLPWKRGIIVLALLLQLADTSRAFLHERSVIASRQGWHTTLTAPVWQALSQDFRHIVFLQPDNVPVGLITYAHTYKDVAYLAARHHMTVNIAYLARVDKQRLKAERQQHIKHLMQGQAEPGTLYVIADKKLWARVKCRHPGAFWYGKINGLNLILPEGSIKATKGEAACG